MGPSSVDDGENIWTPDMVTQKRALQWGRRPWTTESRVRLNTARLAVLLLQWGRRPWTTESQLAYPHPERKAQASMGPSSVDDGECHSPGGWGHRSPGSWGQVTGIEDRPI